MEPLLGAATFEEAAGVFLDRLRRLGLQGRAVVYRRVGERAEIYAEDAGTAPLSVTVWHHLARSQETIYLDLLDCQLWRGRNSVGPLGSGSLDFRSRDRLTRRAVAGLGVVPLRAPLVGVGGMLVVERASGDAADWFDAAPTLQLVADIASPALLGLPAARERLDVEEPLIPVAGLAMREVLADLCRYAPREETILLLGATGVGKSQLARVCHERSGRRGAFVTVVLASIPEALQAGELFGWRKGAYTGADKPGIGRVAEARGGTLFLDEIDKLSLEGQARLLRLLDEGLYSPLGASREEDADVRFIVGTNADLRAAVRERRFLEDLLYRIEVFPLLVPPLAKRRDEICGWVTHVLTTECGGQEVHPDAIALLEAAEWPGNIRQLHSVVLRAAALADPRPIRGEHVRRALFAGQSTGPALIDILRDAARAFRGRMEEAGLVLDDTYAFRGLVLEEAIAVYGEREALERLGYAASVRTGNLQKLVKREEARVTALMRKVSGR
ncbi:MAG: sigma 54-interacting transcriptional regulator [Pseudomonadota bacterium]|nr:sigma 54-interacting transcriptional regulator [Pseudomonadota bacterium]